MQNRCMLMHTVQAGDISLVPVLLLVWRDVVVLLVTMVIMTIMTMMATTTKKIKDAASKEMEYCLCYPELLCIKSNNITIYLFLYILIPSSSPCSSLSRYVRQIFVYSSTDIDEALVF